MNHINLFLTCHKDFRMKPTWNNEFELPDGSYSVSDIQDYIKYIMFTSIELIID